MKKLIILLLCLVSQLAIAQESCGEIDRLERRLEILKDRCGKITKCETFGGMGFSPEEAIEACMSKSFSKSMCIEYLKCDNEKVVKCSTIFSGYTLSKEEAIENCVAKSFTRSMCIERLKCE